jgi:hypothetical protein
LNSKQKKRQGAPRSEWEQGQTIVEFALVISLLFLLIFGIVEFSRLFFAYATMSHGVREAARYGVVHPGRTPELVSDIKEVALDRIFLIGGSASITVTYPFSVAGDYQCSHLCPIQVRAASNYDPWTPIVPSLEIVAQATMHHE